MDNFMLADNSSIFFPALYTTDSQPHHLRPIYPELEYVYFAVNLIIMLCSFFGNGMALVALLATTSQLYPWFVNLVTADLMKTMVCMPYSLYILWNFETFRTPGDTVPSPPYCTAEGTIFLACLLVSLLSNAAIALDRVVAITVPIFYSNIQRRIRPWLLILITWLLVAITALVPAVFTHGYMYADMLPSCNLELHNLFYRITDSSKAKIYAGVTYSILFGIPIIVVCVSCFAVTLKLYKHTFMRFRITTTEHIIGSRVETMETSSFYAKSALAGTNTAAMDQPDNGDKMEMLHRQTSESGKRKSISCRQRLQKRAGITMTLVALTFLGCHICLFVFWALYDVHKDKRKDCFNSNSPEWRYGKCVAFNTLVVTLVYLNAPLNFLIYYYRCSYLRRRMIELLTNFTDYICRTFPGNPVSKLLR